MNTSDFRALVEFAIAKGWARVGQGPRRHTGPWTVEKQRAAVSKNNRDRRARFKEMGLTVHGLPPKGNRRSLAALARWAKTKQGNV